jgi:hypothetical protein
VTLSKRLQRIETSLTPTQAVLLWLKEMLDLGQERYWEKLSADPSNPRVVVLKMVADAIRENLSEPPKKMEELEQAVRAGQKQADMRIMLVLNLHDHVRSECRPNEAYANLLVEKYRRMLQDFTYHGKFESEDWDSWRALLIERLICMRQLKETVVSIGTKYYDGHPLLFANDEDDLNYEIGFLEDLTKSYSRLKDKLPAWQPINIDAQLSSLREHVEALVALRVDIATAKTLNDFGEPEASRELRDSLDFRVRRALKRLRSSSSPQDTWTS